MRTILLPLFLFLPLLATAQKTLTEQNQEFARQLHILNTVLKNLDVYYVDTLDAKKVIGESINCILYNLDPYTQYFTEEEGEDFMESTSGKYAGIGSPISFDVTRKRCVFSYPYEGMPAAEAGVRTGDILLKIDGEDLVCKEGEKPAEYSNRVTSKLRGEAGTTFKIVVLRPGLEQEIELTLTRRVIEVASVPYYGMLDGGVGYIVINSFMENTARDVRRAFVALKQMGMTHLMIDLRGNSGGLVSSAVDIVGFFMPNGTKVVTLRGKIPELEEVYITEDEPLDTKIPLMVIVDDSSASASEITAGALQDYDRAVIVGERTYGKGLVQRSMELPYGGLLKYTISKYFIPSGRCIQAYDFKNRDEDGHPRHLPDSLAKTFYTQAGRPVKDGGGVMPDSIMKSETTSSFAYELLSDTVTFNFLVRHCNTHQAPAFENFSVTDADYAEFKKYVLASSFNYRPRALRMLEVLEETAKGDDVEATEEFESLRKALTPNVEEELERNKQIICDFLELLIVKFYYTEKQAYNVKVKSDKVISKAVELIRNSDALEEILGK